MSQCDASLDFEPRTAWPTSLPAVAVNNMVLAGFHQDLVFNYHLNSTDAEGISQLFRSLYFELSFAEMARLIEKTKSHTWFPTSHVVSKFGWQHGEHFEVIAAALLKTPPGFQNWCAEKKVGPMDLAPLISAQGLDLKHLWADILTLRLSKSQGVKALELGVELLMMGQTPDDLQSSRLLTVMPAHLSAGDAFVEALKQLRFPDTLQRDREAAAKWASLPWPGTSQAQWTRQGDRGGIELKLFVSQPSDLKKYLQSLNRVQEMLEKETGGTKH